MRPDVLVTILTDLLAACTDAYGQKDAPPVPARRFVTHGPAVVEGEQLTVSSLGISSTHPFPLGQLRALKTTVVPSAGVVIEVWRSCWPLAQMSAPSKTLPDPSAFTAAATLLAQDAATLFGWLAELAVDGGLLPSLPTINTAGDISTVPMVPLGPTGQLAGWRFPLAVKISVPDAV